MPHKGYNGVATSVTLHHEILKKTLKMRNLELFTILLSAAALASCGGKADGGNAAPQAVKVETTVVTATTGEASGRYSGTVEEENGTLLSFAVAGTIDRMLVNEGDRVSKGQLIATLDPEQLRSNHDAAKAALAQAEDAYRRMEELHGKGSLPEIKRVEAQTALDRARAAEQVARKQLADCRLYAPFAGVISRKVAERGQNVAAGTTVAKLVSVGTLKVKIAVPENEVAQIAVGQKATVTVNALGGASIRGTVGEKGIVADPLSRSYDVKISVPNEGRRLMPGMVAEVAIDGTRHQEACIIPAHVVQIDEKNNEFVWLAVGGKATKRVITCGEFTASGVVVTSGLAAGDRIITKGQQKVSEGTKVKF